MPERRKTVPVMETSKKILVYCDTVTVVAVAVVFTLAAIDIDITGLSEIVVALIGLSAAAHSFYYWKAKAENMAKFRRKDGITMENNLE